MTHLATSTALWRSCFLGFIVAYATSLHAASLTWDGDTATSGRQDGGGNWNTTDTNRWYDGSAYQLWNNATPDSAIFGSASGTAATVTLTTAISTAGLTFNPAGSGTYTITGTVANKLTLSGSATPVINVNLDAAVTTTISAVLAGTQGFEKTGTGILALTGSLANEYTGTTTVTAGTLTMAKTSGAAAVNGDIIINGGTLRWSGSNQVADTASVTLNSGTLWIGAQTDTIKNLTINGGTNNGGTSSNGGTFIISDTLTVTGSQNLSLNSGANWSANTVVLTGSGTALTLTGNNNTTASRLVIGAGGLSMTGRTISLNTGNGDAAAKGSKIVLNGDVSATGVNTINKSGTNVGVAQVDLGSATRTWNVTKVLTTDVTTVAVAIVGTSTAGFTKTGDGTLLFSGDDANTYSGLTTISAGILQVGKNAGVTAIAGDIQINTGGKLAYTDKNDQIADTATITLNGGTINFNNRAETFANLNQIAAGSNVNPDQGNGSVVTITGTLMVSAGNAIGLNSGGMWTVNATEFRTTFGSGTAISMNGNSNANMNRYTVGSGGIILSGQTISLSKGTNNGGTPSTTAKGSEFVLNGTFTGSGSNTINAGGGTVGVAQVNLNGGQREFNITSGTTTSNAPIVSTTITLTGDDAVASVGGVTKTGTGTLVFTAANTYTGATTIQEGTLRLSGTGSINASATLTVASGATLDVAAVTGGFSVKSGQTLQGGGIVSGATTIDNGGTLALGTIGGDVTQTLTVSGNLTLATGSSTVFDLGTPTFTSTDNFGGNAIGSAGYISYIQAYANASGGNHDRLSSSGTITQNVGAVITVLPNGTTFSSGQIFNLVDWQTAFNVSSNIGSNYRTGAEDDALDLNLPDLTGTGYSWDTSFFASNGIIVVVPEPSRMLFLMAALAAAALRRRRGVTL